MDNRKIKLLIIVILIVFSFLSSNYTIKTDKMYLYNSFMSSYHNEMPFITFFVSRKELKNYFKGKIIYKGFSYKLNNPYRINGLNDKLLITYDKKKNLKFYLFNFNFANDSIESNNIIHIDNKLIQFSVEKNGNLINPVSIFKTNESTKIYLRNIYYVKNNIIVAFRKSYKVKILNFAIYAYVKIKTPFYTKYTDIYGFKVFVDDKLKFEFFNDRIDKFNYSIFKKVIIKRFIYRIPPLILLEGEHKIRIEVYDNKMNKSIIQRTIFVKY